MNSRLELLRRIHQLESDHRPYGILVDGAPIWPVLRIALGGRLLHNEVRSIPASPKAGVLELLQGLAMGIVHTYAPNAVRIQRPLLFFSSRTYRADTPSGTKDRFAHPLMEAAGSMGLESILIVKDRPPLRPYVQSKGCHIQYVHAAHRIRSFMHWREAPTELASITGTAVLLEDIKRKFNLGDLKFMDIAVHDLRLYLKTYLALFQRVRPRHVFVTCWYAIENIAIAHTCYRLGIPCTDLQHGVQGPSHLAYSTWHGMPASGCSSIPSSFWCWDETSAANIRSWAPPGHHQPYVGGSPWLEGYGTSEPDIPEDDAKTILFCLQPLIRFLPEGLEKAIQDAPSSVRWVFRLHPNALEQVGALCNWAELNGIADRIAIEHPAEVPLHRSLSRASLHLTQYSSVIREAALLAVPSMAFYPQAKSMFEDLVANGMLTINLDASRVDLGAISISRSSGQFNPKPLSARLLEIMELSKL